MIAHGTVRRRLNVAPHKRAADARDDGIVCQTGADGLRLEIANTPSQSCPSSCRHRVPRHKQRAAHFLIKRPTKAKRVEALLVLEVIEARLWLLLPSQLGREHIEAVAIPLTISLARSERRESRELTDSVPRSRLDGRPA